MDSKKVFFKESLKVAPDFEYIYKLVRAYFGHSLNCQGCKLSSEAVAHFKHNSPALYRAALHRCTQPHEEWTYDSLTKLLVKYDESRFEKEKDIVFSSSEDEGNIFTSDSFEDSWIPLPPRFEQEPIKENLTDQELELILDNFHYYCEHDHCLDSYRIQFTIFKEHEALRHVIPSPSGSLDDFQQKAFAISRERYLEDLRRGVIERLQANFELAVYKPFFYTKISYEDQQQVWIPSLQVPKSP